MVLRLVFLVAQMPLCLEAQMFGAFSKLFKKSDAVPNFQTLTEPVRQDPPPAQKLLKGRAATQPSLCKRSKPLDISDEIIIPYSSIIKQIPSELWGQLAPAGVAGHTLPVSRRFVLEQIACGAVKVSFGEIRMGAPAGIFVNTSSEDSRQVNLPLGEILSQ